MMLNLIRKLLEVLIKVIPNLKKLCGNLLRLRMLKNLMIYLVSVGIMKNRLQVIKKVKPGCSSLAFLLFNVTYINIHKMNCLNIFSK
jgi:hypothetical protein